MSKDYISKQKEIDAFDLEGKIKERQELWLKAKGKLDSSIALSVLKEEGKKYIDIISALHKIKDIERTSYQKELDLKKKLIKTYNNLPKTVEKNEIKKQIIIDTYIRDVQIKKYDNYKSEETIHILYVLSFVFLLCILIVIANLNKMLDNYILLLSLIMVLVLFLLYVIKILVIDNVNINNFIYSKYDYNNPTQEEINMGKIKDKMYNSISDNTQDECGEPIDYHGTANEENKILEKVKKETAGSRDVRNCLL